MKKITSKPSRADFNVHIEGASKTVKLEKAFRAILEFNNYGARLSNGS